MINFKVFRLGDIGKNLVKVMILIIGIILLTRFFNVAKKVDLNKYVEDRKKAFNTKSFAKLLKENIGETSKENSRLSGNTLTEELGFSEGFTKENKEEYNNYSNEEFGQGDNSSKTADNMEYEGLDEREKLKVQPDEVSNINPPGSVTSIITENNKKDVYNAVYSNVQIRNQTSVQLAQEMLVPDVNFDKSNIIIFHTHTSESYTPTENYNYIPSGNFRTQDTNSNVVGVGNELTRCLQNKGINVIHDSTFHDYPEYNGAYTRSLHTVQNILQTNRADLVIDLHRDAIGDSNYGPSVMIGDEKVAQLMFVMGSNEGGLEHPNWIQNLKIAIKIQEKANEMYPGLFKPILLSKYRYNEHVAKGACIIEVGATGNTMEECIGSMKYLAEVIAAIE